MKYIIVSDIHGSSVSAEFIISKFKELNADKIIILGDILYHGPRNDLPEWYNPKSVIKTLNEYKNKIIAVKGNCDAYVDEMVLDFDLSNCKTIALNGVKTYLTHGHIINPSNPVNKDLDLVLYGHTHIYDIEDVNGVMYINPGSITIPKNNTKKSFAVMEDKTITIYDMDMNKIKEFSFEL